MSGGNLPAFPCEAQGDRSVPVEHDYLQIGTNAAKFPGMTLRDWFASQALVALIGKAEAVNSDGWSWRTGTLAGDAYAFADDMLEVRDSK